MSETELNICVVGGGPRGTVLLERVCANVEELAGAATVHVHVIDPHPVGAGRIWHTEQSRLLLMNTVAADVSVFTDRSVVCEGAIRPGPSQYEWAAAVASGTVPADPATRREARDMQPWTYATRAFQGRYLGWAFEHITDTAPAQVRVHVHRTRAVGVDDRPDGRQLVRLESGAPVVADAVVIAQGHLPVAPTPIEQGLADFAAGHDAWYVPPGSPAEVDLGGIRDGEPVILRGLGLSFFDYLALLTEGRGGSYERRDGTLVYLPSGREPVLHAGSWRGVPYQARAEVRAAVVERRRPQFLTDELIARFRERAGTIDFRTEVWPIVAKEAGWVYYGLLLADEPAAVREEFLAEFARCEWGSERMARLIERAVPDPARRWEWRAGEYPGPAVPEFTDAAQHREWVMELLAADAAASRLGPARSAAKATSALLRDLRDEIRQVISHQGLRGSSYRDDIDGWFSGLNNFLSSGPPAARVEQLVALAEAGVVRFMGPRMTVRGDADRGAFVATSGAVPGPPVTARVLIEARIPLSDLRRTTDPLLRDLLRTGGVRAHRIPDPDGTGYQTGGVDVTAVTMHVVQASGRSHPGRFCFGPPIESVQWSTQIGVRPLVNSRTLQQGDGIARTALRLGLRLAATGRPAGQTATSQTATSQTATSQTGTLTTATGPVGALAEPVGAAAR